MTDAALPVTQSAVEEFTEHYIESLGGTVEKKRDLWEVTIPDDGNTELPTGSLSLHCTTAKDEDATGEPLHPESEFFQRILRESSERHPTGELSIETDRDDVQIPQWIEESGISVKESRFTPYYDRTAIVVLFEVGIETVSEYQQEFLRAIAIDHRSEQRLSGLEDIFLRTTSLTRNEQSATSQSSLAEADIQPLLDTAQSQLMESIQDEIDEIHNEASRAADAEIEEYRQMQQQRVRELEEERSKLSEEIDELSETISDSDQGDRVEALKERKEVKTEYEEVNSKLNRLHERRDQGFPQKQKEIRNRHALDIRVTPLTITQVEYERGEIDIELSEQGTTRTVTLGYGSGIGATESIRCSSCDTVFSAENPLQSIEDSLQCSACDSSEQ